MRYRKKPIEVEALQFTGDAEVIRSWQYRYIQQVGFPSTWFFLATDAPVEATIDCDAVVYDYLHRTWVELQVGDWIIKGIQDEFYPCKDTVFRATYDALEG